MKILINNINVFRKTIQFRKKLVNNKVDDI